MRRNRRNERQKSLGKKPVCVILICSFSVKYNNNLPWSPLANGFGSSLELICPPGGNNADEAWRWQASDVPGKNACSLQPFPHLLLCSLHFLSPCSLLLLLLLLLIFSQRNGTPTSNSGEHQAPQTVGTTFVFRFFRHNQKFYLVYEQTCEKNMRGKKGVNNLPFTGNFFQSEKKHRI